MRINDNEFPVVVQAYDTTDPHDRFVAEQVVSTQAEVDIFTNRYAGKLIKVRTVAADDVSYDRTTKVVKKRSASGAGTWVLILLVLAALVIAGFATGWIQRTFGLNLNF